MRVIDINALGEENFNPIFINAIRQYWKNTKSFQCIGSPKQQNLLLYIDGCKITYTDKSGKSFVANSGELVYTPIGSEYRANLSDFTSSSSHTVGMNFLLYDTDGTPIVLSDGIRIFHVKDVSAISALFDRATLDDSERAKISNRIILLEILSTLIYEPSSLDDSVIASTIEYLSANIEENPSVKELAERLNISEVYLRRKFKEKIGVSPAKYRNELRLSKAISYLKFGDISIQEISDTLGYSTVSHFIKEFKRRFECSPLKYRKSEDTKMKSGSLE